MVIPVRVEVEADTETPVSAFLKLSRGEPHAFLFESVEGGERSGRWSFLGARPRAVHTHRLDEGGAPLAPIIQTLSRYRAVRVDEGAPRFTGGLVGHLSYDLVSHFEPRVPLAHADELGFHDVFLMDFDTVVAFDNLRHVVHVIAQARCGPDVRPKALYAATAARIARVLRRLKAPLVDRRPNPNRRPAKLSPRVTRKAFEAAVARAREYVCAGDCQQIVLSQRFDAEVDVPPFEIYRALRRINPSPYLFFVREGERALVGSSPETLVRLERGDITLRPIAGTRPRGRTPEEDARREAELRADPKENAEHVMLVDLGRNDVGRVAEIGSVKVDVLKSVERYSHVLHLVSQVKGRLAEGKTCLDVLRSSFPAGTVSGSPKVRAMEIIDALEPARRGPYAGCVGYIDLSGNMEMAIAIRTLFQTGRRISVQAGAGVVYDSVPAHEYAETLNKARALFTAVEQAQSRSLTSPQAPRPASPSARPARPSTKRRRA